MTFWKLRPTMNQIKGGTVVRGQGRDGWSLVVKILVMPGQGPGF